MLQVRVLSGVPFFKLIMSKLIITTIAAAVVCSSALGQELEPGDKIWSFKTGGWVTSPAIESDGTIYVGSQDNYLYAINPDGSQKWAYKTGNGVHGSPTIGSDGTIYVGSWDQYLYAIKPDGKRKWRFKTNGTVWSRPVIGSDGTVYAGSWDYYFWCAWPSAAMAGGLEFLRGFAVELEHVVVAWDDHSRADGLGQVGRFPAPQVSGHFYGARAGGR